MADEAKGERIGPYRTLDAWRGVAALAVVLFHWGEMVVYSSHSLASYPLYQAFRYGYLGVQIFFVISGYCIAAAAVANVRRSEGAVTFMKARVRRIYPTYWAGLVLTLAFYYVGYLLVRLGALHPNIYTQADPLTASPFFYLTNLSLTMVWLRQPELLAVAWTLSYEMAFYVIFAVLLGLLSAAGKARHLLTTLHGLTILSLVWLIVSPSSAVFPLNMWPQFGLGIIVYDLAANPKRPLPKALAAVTYALLILFVTRYDLIWTMGQPQRLTFLVAAGFALLLAVLYRFDQQISSTWIVKRIAFCGTFSFSLYLTQVVSLRILNQATAALHFPASLHLLLLPVAIAFSVAAAYGFFLLFERPLLKRGKSRELPLPPNVPGSQAMAGDARTESTRLRKETAS